MRALLLVVLAASAPLRAQDLPAVEVREIAGTKLRYAVQLPPQWQPGTWAPLLFVIESPPPLDGGRKALAAIGEDLPKAGFVVVAPVDGEPTADLRPLFAELRRTFRIEQGGMHAALVDEPESGVAAILAHRAEFQTITLLDTVPATVADGLRRLPARRVAVGVAAAERSAHFQKLHAERVLPGAAGDIARVLDDFHDAAANGDEARYFAILPDDAVFLGTDGTERWTGASFRREFAKYFERDSAWTYVCLRRAVDVDAGGQWATFDETLDNTAYGECRGSGVVVQREGRWVLRQYHLTIPVPNDVARPVAARIREFQDRLAPAAARTVIVVRHAEKVDAGKDAELSDAGTARAEALAAVLRDVKLTAVVSSQYLRTVQTVGPTCKAQGLEVRRIPADDGAGLAAAVAKLRPGETALVCGHSNTVPGILKNLGIREPVTIADDEFDRLFVVTLDAEGRGVQMLALRYGAR